MSELKDFYSHKAKALLVADPDCPPDQLAFVRDLLVTGGTGTGSHEFVGSVSVYEEIIEREIADQADFVVVLRTERQPSREVKTAVRLADAHKKAVQVLTVRGLQPGVLADEYHEIEATPPSDLSMASQELLRWSVELPKRYGHAL
jgi:hypothetical protein